MYQGTVTWAFALVATCFAERGLCQEERLRPPTLTATATIMAIFDRPESGAITDMMVSTHEPSVLIATWDDLLGVNLDGTIASVRRLDKPADRGGPAGNHQFVDLGLSASPLLVTAEETNRTTVVAYDIRGDRLWSYSLPDSDDQGLVSLVLPIRTSQTTPAFIVAQTRREKARILDLAGQVVAERDWPSFNVVDRTVRRLQAPPGCPLRLAGGWKGDVLVFDDMGEQRVRIAAPGIKFVNLVEQLRSDDGTVKLLVRGTTRGAEQGWCVVTVPVHGDQGMASAEPVDASTVRQLRNQQVGVEFSIEGIGTCVARLDWAGLAPSSGRLVSVLDASGAEVAHTHIPDSTLNRPFLDPGCIQLIRTEPGEAEFWASWGSGLWKVVIRP